MFHHPFQLSTYSFIDMASPYSFKKRLGHGYSEWYALPAPCKVLQYKKRYHCNQCRSNELIQSVISTRFLASTSLIFFQGSKLLVPKTHMCFSRKFDVPQKCPRKTFPLRSSGQIPLCLQVFSTKSYPFSKKLDNHY